MSDADRVRRLEEELDDAESQRDENVQRVHEIVNAIDEAEDWNDLHERVRRIVGFGPQGPYYPHWLRPQ